MLLLLLFHYVVCVTTYKILVFSPTISRSHMISNGRIADELAKAGHDVVLFEPDFLNISAAVMSSKIARRWTVYGFAPALRNVLQGFSETAFEQFSLLEEHRGLLLYSRAYNELCEDLINRDELIDALRAEKFDGYFGEQINLCGNGLAHVLGIKSHFWVSSCPIGDHMAWILGMPQPSSFIPSLIAMDITHRPSYIERVQNVWATFLPNFPSLEDIAADSDMVFVSTDEFIEFPRPSLPNIVHIGGLGLGTSKETSPLNKVFAEQMEMGANGVIYFSLGTLVNTSSLPAFAMEAVIETARRTPDHHFILVADRHDQKCLSVISDKLNHFQHTRQLAEHLKNVFVCSWAPQPAILGEPMASFLQLPNLQYRTCRFVKK
ncbi:unnamed protein product [Nippostrongylus brasiliensis]|uniref:glucuronosyltransferase n=1 Tax=Nippostrongylus brasiliensis TaxID=27835 RepID=A0A0N4XSY2_NIPBR|nr:unnamed protein product [Nippostrongylus brasiliensis]